MAVREDMVRAIAQEINLQKDYLNNEAIGTIYFGGGTPSILSAGETGILFNEIFKHFHVNTNAEITIECNPEDLTGSKLSGMLDLGINRLSIGIQSFHDEQLKFLHRSHDKKTALESYFRARSKGFPNINIDLIYGLPAPGHEIWEYDLKNAVEISPEHISAYCLTIEPKTVFGNWQAKGKLHLPDENFTAEQLEMTMRVLEAAGYDHYEISNFARPGFLSRHNTAYWLHEKYLGVGPGAHSFNGTSRQFNVRNNHKYIRAIKKGEVPCEKEILSIKDKANEFLMTGLRTKWGCDIKILKSEYGYDIFRETASRINWLIDHDYLRRDGSVILLTSRGKLLADQITADLFWV